MKYISYVYVMLLMLSGCSSRSYTDSDNYLSPLINLYNRNFIVAAPTRVGNYVCGAPFFFLAGGLDALLPITTSSETYTEWFMLFNSAGVAIKGFFHESQFANDGLFATQLKQSVPSEFSAFLNEPAFSINDATFCYWRRASDSFWNKVHHPSPDKLNTEDGSVELMSLLVGQPSDYQRWALEYYELSSLQIKSIVDIFQHSPLNQSLVLSLNPDSLFEDVLTDAKEIGYPVASS